MLNESAFRKIFEIPPTRYVEIFKPVKVLETTGKPRSYNLASVIDSLSNYEWFTLSELSAPTGLSKYCLHKCIKYLIASGDVVKKLIGKTGKFDVFSYQLA